MFLPLPLHSGCGAVNSYLHVAALLSSFNERHCGGGPRETVLIIWKINKFHIKMKIWSFGGLFA